ncbi:M20/M25/M40 family metallo-hydrolase [Sphingomonas rhizophila]|uniref:M20/M25/M40 family metallo-hydrolase n=1 Tax=Sphingomonas rhizophila TaxID=2071607 RepID=A0A7G9S9R6_9SPHN|nr:M20/M25/M40 family metallo-hydrolase [Sphingomonas rhizophila]QNN64591.1 M20/M25/M40 family metallo-hydrolase [Sphingomonas rhizophila]
MTKFFRALAIAALITATPALAAPLTRAEQRMLTTVDAEQARSLALLERMVNQNSGTNNPAGVEKVAAMVRAELVPLGFAVRWIPMKQVGRAGHLVAHHKARGGGKRLLLIGHLDTVFEPDSPFQTLMRTGDKANGPGAGDDKGGITVMIAALRAMKAAGTLDRSDITIFLTGDEEDAGDPKTVSRRDLVAAGRAADVALDFEGLSIDAGRDMGVVSRRGSVEWTLTVKGRSAHSSGVFSAASGYGANYELVRILDTFRRELPEDKLTFNVGLILGGTTAALDKDLVRGGATGKTNVIAAQAVARGDLRALTPDQVRRTQDRMRAIVAQSLNGATASIAFEEGYPPMAPTPGNRALLAVLNGVNASMGLPAQEELDPIKRGAGDIGFVAADIDGLVGLGPASSGDHTPAETVDIPSIWRQAKRAAILMSRLAASRR